MADPTAAQMNFAVARAGLVNKVVECDLVVLQAYGAGFDPSMPAFMALNIRAYVPPLSSPSSSAKLSTHSKPFVPNSERVMEPNDTGSNVPVPAGSDTNLTVPRVPVQNPKPLSREHDGSRANVPRSRGRGHGGFQNAQLPPPSASSLAQAHPAAGAGRARGRGRAKGGW